MIGRDPIIHLQKYFMKILKTILLLVSFVVVSHSLSAQDEKQDANSVINHAIEAMGGSDYLLSIKTMYTEISTEMEGRPVVWATKEMLPNKGAFQIIYEGRIVFENFFDGKKGYEIVDGKKQKADPEEFKDKKYKNNIFNEFDYLDPSLWTITLTGEEEFNGENCYKIHARLVNGEERNLYYGKKSFYLLRQDKILNPEKNSFTSSYYSDYKKFGDLTTFATISFGSEGKFQTGKIITVKLNENISDKDFQ
jgi:hypothetical protein